MLLLLVKQSIRRFHSSTNAGQDHADRVRLVNRIQKTLEDTNIKLASVATDITDKSSRAILEAMLAGEQNPQKLAELAQKRMQGKQEQLVEALQGTLGEHHSFLLAGQFRQVDFFDQQIRELDQEIARLLAPLTQCLCQRGGTYLL